MCIGSTIYTRGEQDVIEQFQVIQTVATLGLTLFVLGYAIGLMFLAPLAEALTIGRNPVYLTTLLIFVLFKFAVVYNPNIATLLAFRFLTGFIGSPVLTTDGASLADLWSRRKVAYAIGIWDVSAVCGPVLGPLCLVVLIFTLPETNVNTVLSKRVKRLRELTGNTRLKSEADLMTESIRFRDVGSASFFKPFQL
ncbi:hypothetical protein KCU78_g12650, partial [Aureobasidium melanogenum]